MRHWSTLGRILIVVLYLWRTPLASGQCPWSRELVDLHTDCVCAYSNSQRLSIQCSPVNFTKLVSTLRSSVMGIPIDLLYVSNSTIEILANNSFDGLRIQSLHLSKSKVREVEDEAFSDLEESLTSLNLQDNLLREVPIESLKRLSHLQMLDLSHNLIQRVDDDAFKGLPLSTLKLSDNKLNISHFAFRGLEGTLKNLNLQAADLTEIPKAIQRLKTLAFLDLAQNKIQQLEPEFLAEMQSLTAINLERNKIRDIDEKAFAGVNATLSSLSLLNNQLSEYPLEAIAMLTEVRVLDLGFNGIASLPHDAFKKNKYLTLLALDGNPLPTLPVEAFSHLNSTLRGLSLGGSALRCDCQLRWVAEWADDRDLQVTSRERNPQFCGSPEHLRRRIFQKLLPSDFTCDNETRPLPTKRPKRLNADFDAERNNDVADKVMQIVTIDTHLDITGTTRADSKGNFTSNDEPVRTGSVNQKKEDNLSMIRIKHAFKRDSSLVLEWEPAKESIKGYQVLIRMFGSRDLKRIIPIPKDKRRLQVEHLPLSQCIVVCVIEYEDPANIKIESIPSKQCRELKGDDSRILSIDKIAIAAAAVVCIVVIIGALIVILFYFRRRELLSTPSSSSMHPHVSPPGVLPAMVKQQPPPETDWETLSWNSGRSTPKTNVQNCLVSKSGTTSHSFVLSDGQLHSTLKAPRSLANGFSKSYSTHDNESRLSYSHISKVSPNNLDIQRSKSLNRPNGYHHPYTGGYIKKKKQRPNGRLASASSSTECESDWNGRSIWKDNDVDIYISQNHMVPGVRKYRKDYSIR
ncbi:leucine-rich repeat neuronal protein 1-like [Uloborus diversus]|uniref:leucine-rich repeat neuronal protein 1-like n=1 Tax=Uloborus diversus TaxID=327109 RepID=UPI00240A2F31|nr:leucine-rich repeat neuronal protein 1-like [Uloborus diversus]XP_054718665.1 leucine-rich repeat neuronal protein 1-like [Uloborus diversus]